MQDGFSIYEPALSASFDQRNKESIGRQRTWQQVQCAFAREAFSQPFRAFGLKNSGALESLNIRREWNLPHIRIPGKHCRYHLLVFLGLKRTG